MPGVRGNSTPTRWSTLPNVDVVEDKVFKGHHVGDVRDGVILRRR